MSPQPVEPVIAEEQGLSPPIVIPMAVNITRAPEVDEMPAVANITSPEITNSSAAANITIKPELIDKNSTVQNQTIPDTS